MSSEEFSVPSDFLSSNITLRAPAGQARGATTQTLNWFEPPFIPWLIGTWHVTHSTLPMWKKARNVCITYSVISYITSSNPQLDDSVTYQGLSSDKVKKISGIDTSAGPGAWNWRGRGWLKIASSHWEILGFGGEQGGDGEQWVVTYFAKTLFTPAGIDIYSRRKEGLSERTVEGIKEALDKLEDDVVRKLVAKMFVVKSD